MPAALWYVLFGIGACLFFLLALLTYEKARELWRRYRHENGKPDVRIFRRDDEDEGGA